MPFSVNDRVRVTNQNSDFRRALGTVEEAAATTADGFNKVRLDGHLVGETVKLADNEIAATNFVSPIQY